MNREHIHTISEAFGLDPNLALFEIAKGHAGTIYKLSSDDKEYVLHVSSYVDEQLLENEVAIYKQMPNTLTARGMILRQTNGELYLRIGKEFSRLNHFITGHHAEEGNVSEDECYLFGRTLAAFHDSVKSLPYPDKLSFVRDSIEGHVRTDLKKLSSHAPQLYAAATRFASTDLPTGIIHGDFHVNNGLLSQGNIAMIDFERAGEGILIVDIARSAIDLCRTGSTFSQRKLDSFLSGYGSVRRINLNELAMLRPSLAYSALIVADWFYQQGQVTQLSTFLAIGNTSLE